MSADVDKADIANVIAAGLIVAGMAYAVLTSNTQLVTTFGAAGIGYLFGKAAKPNAKPQ